jgi:hypothetical protein
MTSASVIQTTTVVPRLAALAEVRNLPAWRNALRHLAKDHRYFELVADTLGFDSRVLVLEDHAGNLLAMQPCFFVEQDLVVAGPAPLRSLTRIIRRVLPRFLRLKMLMVGCAAGEGHLTAAPEFIPVVQRGVRNSARGAGAWLIVWKDMPARYRRTMEILHGPAADCVRIASMPATRLALDFTSFDDYLARHVSHAMRKNLRRKFKALTTAQPLTMTVTNDLGDAVDDALALYEQVFARSPLQFERLTKSFLQQLATHLPERVRFFLWRQSGHLVAFSICLVYDGELYDEYLGLDYRIALDLHLYFVTFRDVLTWALAEGLTAYHSTPLNYDPKLHLGFALVPLDLYVALPWPVLNRLARPFLRRISPTRAEPMLSRFTNAHEMGSRA